MGQYGYRVCDAPNRTRQAILVVAYIMMVILAVSAVFAGSGGEQQTAWAAESQPAEVVKFTSFRTGHETIVTLEEPAEPDVQVLTREDMIAGMRILHRGGLHHADTLLRIQRRAHGYAVFPAIIAELKLVLRQHDAWTAEDSETLKSVLAEKYPHIVIR